MDRLPLYKLQIDKDAEGMDYMGLVDFPAHGKNWLTFNKQTPKKTEFKQHFNDEKRIVTGVAIATNLPIYRRKPDGTEYNVIFTKQDTRLIAVALAENGYMNNVNEMHDLNRDVKGLVLFESFFIEDDKRNIPDAFLNQNLQPGSWIVSYKVNNDEVWEKMKKGEFVGFSIEGWFKEVEVNIKKEFKSKKKQMKKRSLMSLLGFAVITPEALKFDKEKHAEATTVDGVLVMWEGDSITAGETSLFLQDAENEGEMILASAGEYSFEVDGVLMVATVDEAGVIAAFVEAEEGEAETEETEEELSAEVAEAMTAMKAHYEKEIANMKEDFNTKLKTTAEAFDSLVEKFEVSQEGDSKQKHNQEGNSPGWKRKK